LARPAARPARASGHTALRAREREVALRSARMASVGVPPDSGRTEEGEEPLVPLPQYWDVEALRGMRVVLYQNKISPPCCKIRMLLRYYGVPFQTVEGRKPESGYKNIPVLDIGDRQINDSVVIVRSLAPVLQGRPLTGDELEIERLITSGLMVALERDVAGSVQDLCACADLLGGCFGCVLRSSACCICCCVGPRRIGAGREVLSIREYGDALREHLGGGEFLGGGEKPSVIDLSLFGLLEPFVRASCSCMAKLFGGPENRLAEWHARMRQATSDIDIFA